MKLKNISIVNYRNISQADLSFSPKLNGFIGKNGMGKTNVLDAIYYLSFCKGTMSASDAAGKAANGSPPCSSRILAVLRELRAKSVR